MTALEAYEWCEQNATGEWKIRRGTTGTPYPVIFQEDRDVMLFKLSW